MIINGESFSERELEYIQMLNEQEQEGVIRNTMGTRYPLNPIAIAEKFISVLISAFNRANRTE